MQIMLRIFKDLSLKEISTAVLLLTHLDTIPVTMRSLNLKRRLVTILKYYPALPSAFKPQQGL